MSVSTLLNKLALVLQMLQIISKCEFMYNILRFSCCLYYWNYIIFESNYLEYEICNFKKKALNRAKARSRQSPGCVLFSGQVSTNFPWGVKEPWQDKIVVDAEVGCPFMTESTANVDHQVTRFRVSKCTSKIPDPFWINYR